MNTKQSIPDPEANVEIWVPMGNMGSKKLTLQTHCLKSEANLRFLHPLKEAEISS